MQKSFITKPAISNSVSRLTIEFIVFAADGKVGCFPREYRKKHQIKSLAHIAWECK